MNKHAYYQEQICLYILQILPEDEKKEIVTHLDECPSCREYLETYQISTYALAQAPQQHKPRYGVERRVMQQIKPVSSWKNHLQITSWHDWKLAPVLASLLLFGFLLWGAGSVQVGDDGPEPRFKFAQVDALLAPQAAANISEFDRRSQLVAHRLPQKDGYTYHLWVKDRSGKILAHRSMKLDSDGNISMALPKAKSARDVLVTVESNPAVKTPAGPVVISAKL